MTDDKSKGDFLDHTAFPAACPCYGFRVVKCTAASSEDVKMGAFSLSREGRQASRVRVASVDSLRCFAMAAFRNPAYAFLQTANPSSANAY
jgi:hypothetical protein